MDAPRFRINPYFAIMVAIPTLLVVWYLFQIIEWLKRNFADFWAAHWFLIVLVGVVLLTPLWWRAYRAIYLHMEDRADRHTYRALLGAVSDQARAGYNLEFTNGRTGEALKLTNPYSGRAHVQLQEVEPAPALQIEAPQAIPDVIRYEDVADDVPANQSLLGIRPEDGTLELTHWEKLKALWLVGSSSTGKSNTIFGKALEAVQKGAKLLVVDQHAVKEDSLARKLAPLSRSFLAPVAVKDDEVLATLAAFKTEFERRVNGSSCKQKIVLICDEMNRMVRNDDLKKALQEIVAICGEESRGFGMYGWFLSQKCAGLKWLRDSAITVIAHRLTRFEEALLACNDDRKAAKRLLNFKVGRTYIYGVDFDEPVELQQPLYSATIVEADQVLDLADDEDEAIAARLEMPPLPERSTGPLAGTLRDTRPSHEQDRLRFFARNQELSEPDTDPFARSVESSAYAQENGVESPENEAQGTQRGAKYRLTDIQIAQYRAIFPFVGDRDERLRQVGANTSYREHAKEIEQQYGLRKGS